MLENLILFAEIGLTCSAAAGPPLVGILQGYRDGFQPKRVSSYVPAAATGVAAMGIPVVIAHTLDSMANESPINREIPDTLFFRFAAYGIAYGAVTQAFGYAVGRKLRPSAQ